MSPTVELQRRLPRTCYPPITGTTATFRTGTPITTGSSDFNFGNFIYFSIRDALEAVPSFDGDNIAFTHFLEGCEEALSMIAPSQEIILVRAIRNKLKGDAHRSMLGKVFSSLQGLVEFLRSKYGPRETVYEAQA